MNVYLTDGTPACFYTAVFSACTDKSCIVTPARDFQIPLGAALIEVVTDTEKSARVQKKLRAIDGGAIREISLILRRGCAEREMTALEYIRLLVERKAPVRDMLSHPAVLEARDAIKKVTGEAHNFTGFLRFMEGENGVFYAPFSPDNDILELILPHFLRRLANQPFVIHDVARRKAALYNTRDCVIADTDERVSVALSEYEQGFQNLWKEYYRSVNIAQRPHEKQMKGYMPVRYWKFMPEKQGDTK
mgnify:FL=1